MPSCGIDGLRILNVERVRGAGVQLLLYGPALAASQHRRLTDPGRGPLHDALVGNSPSRRSSTLLPDVAARLSFSSIEAQFVTLHPPGSCADAPHREHVEGSAAR